MSKKLTVVLKFALFIGMVTSSVGASEVICAWNVDSNGHEYMSCFMLH